VFDNLGKTAEDFFFRQSFQQIHVTDDKLRLPENTDHVFITAEIDAIFPAHTGIHLGQKSGGYKAEIHTPQIGGRGKTGNITDNAAPNAEDKGSSVRFPFHQLPEDFLYGFKGFNALAGSDFNDRRVRKIFVIQIPDMGICNKDDLSFVRKIFARIPHIFAHQNERGSCAAVNFKSFHCKVLHSFKYVVYRFTSSA